LEKVVAANLEAITIESAISPTATVIWLHGLGANGDDFAPIVPQLQLSDHLPVRFVFPHAPLLPVTLNQGMLMPAWYDILGLGPGVAEDEAGVINSMQAIHALIAKQEAAGIASTRIAVVGFSQGGAMALYAGLRYPRPLAGIMALSAYLPLLAKIKAERDQANQHTPIFIAHGVHDQVVLPEWGKKGEQELVALGYAVAWKSYPMAHTVCVAEIDDIAMQLMHWFGAPTPCCGTGGAQHT
jgi:phospholipase/carboxylesterase